MERETLKRALVVGAIALLAGAEVAQAVYTHRLAEEVKNARAPAPAIALSAQPVAMTLEPWNHPFSYLRQVQTAFDRQERAMARIFSFLPQPMTVGMTAAPRAGMVETISLQNQPSQYVVRAKLPPGVGAKQVKVDLDGRQLTLSTEVTGHAKGQGVDGSQSYSSAYMESFTLPGPVAVKAMKQQISNGVLTVTIPKASAPKVSI